MSTATPTRQRLIEAAGRRFYRDGFRMVGLDQILADVGISKTAFYKHFESKDDLVLAALADHDREMQDTFRQMIRERGGPTPLRPARGRDGRGRTLHRDRRISRAASS